MTQAEKPSHNGRAVRTAAALRENLKRRKAQARGRAVGGEGGGSPNSAGIDPDKHEELTVEDRS
ncbi:MAG: hypothetical protein AB7K04_06560 [Pseudorhodoplanes sp.]